VTGALLITGGSRGIGAATAKLAAARGWRVCFSYAQDARAAEEVVRAIEAAGGAALAVKSDVRQHAEIVALFDSAERAFGPVTGLVNNAGITGRIGPLPEAAPDMIREVVDTNVTGAILTAREAVRRMSTARGGQGGAIVNISSGAATLGSPGEYVHYAASKGAIDTLTLGLAKEVATEGVRVNCVRPGIIRTEIHGDSGDVDRPAKAAASLPMGRPGEADEVAAAIAWLMSDEASYTNGAILDVSGAR
jgi:NAD(P)-dependent dehydrogenase (short-subunit alcohol dehydrogenase family)